MRKIIKILNQIEEWTLVLVLLGLSFLIFIEAICRYFLSFNFTWTEELGRYLGVFITFLGASLGVKYGMHFSMDLLYEKVSGNRFRHALKVAINLVSGVTFLIVAWYGWEQTMKLRGFGATTPALQLPKYWAYLPVPFFSVIMSIRFFNLGYRHFRGLLRNEPFTMMKLES